MTFRSKDRATMRERYRAFARRAFDEKVREDEEEFRAAQVPLYCLPSSFQGPRMLGKRRVAAGGWAARGLDTVTVHFEFIHGNLRERPLRLLVVATSRHPEPPRQPTPLRHFLWERVVAEMVATMRPRRRIARISLPKREDVGGPERPVVVPIDHVPRTFTLIEADQAQVAELNLPDHRVMLRAQRWPLEDIELVTVTDLTPYLEGWRRCMTQLRTRFGADRQDP